MRVLKFILRLMLVLLCGALAAAAGLILGALIGGNFAQQFQFNGVQGYEATGQLGFFLGLLGGLLLGALLVFKKKRAA